MATKLIANYSKKVGLPGYSSVQYSLTVETEVIDLQQVENRSRELHELLQENVDRELQNPGFVPDASYGKQSSALPSRNGHHPNGSSDIWACSPKQKDLILKLVEDHQLDKQAVENLSNEWHRKPVKTLSKLEASAFIADLIDFYRLQGGPKRAVRPVNGSRRRA